jgi:hypothetical protein
MFGNLCYLSEMFTKKDGASYIHAESGEHVLKGDWKGHE